MTDNVWQKWIECSCHDEGIMLAVDEDFSTIDLALFKFGKFSGSLSLKEKFRYCLRVLFKGTPFLDEIVLSKDNAKELAQELLKFSRKTSRKGELPINLGK